MLGGLRCGSRRVCRARECGSLGRRRARVGRAPGVVPGATRCTWHGEFDRSRTAMLELIAATSDLQIVVISRPVPPRRQERARARCTESLLAQLQVLDPPVHDVVLESRTHVLDRRDGARIEGLRASMRIGPGLRFSFATKSEPLLWIADAVAGAESARVRGDDRYAQALGDRLIRIDIPGVP